MSENRNQKTPFFHIKYENIKSQLNCKHFIGACVTWQDQKHLGPVYAHF